MLNSLNSSLFFWFASAVSRSSQRRSNCRVRLLSALSACAWILNAGFILRVFSNLPLLLVTSTSISAPSARTLFRAISRLYAMSDMTRRRSRISRRMTLSERASIARHFCAVPRAFFSLSLSFAGISHSLLRLGRHKKSFLVAREVFFGTRRSSLCVRQIVT